MAGPATSTPDDWWRKPRPALRRAIAALSAALLAHAHPSALAPVLASALRRPRRNGGFVCSAAAAAAAARPTPRRASDARTDRHAAIPCATGPAGRRFDSDLAPPSSRRASGARGDDVAARSCTWRMSTARRRWGGPASDRGDRARRQSAGPTRGADPGGLDEADDARAMAGVRREELQHPLVGAASARPRAPSRRRAAGGSRRR